MIPCVTPPPLCNARCASATLLQGIARPPPHKRRRPVLPRRREPRLDPRLRGETARGLSAERNRPASSPPPRRRPGPSWGTVVTQDSTSSQRPPHLDPGLRRGGAIGATYTMLFVDIVQAARKEMAPPRRRPGPSWGTVVTQDSASSQRPSHLDPGRRRGGARDAACTMLFVDIVPAARKGDGTTPAKAGAQLGDGGNAGQRVITATFPPGPRPSPGWSSGGVDSGVGTEANESAHRTNPGTPIQPRRHVRCSLRYCPPPAATP